MRYRPPPSAASLQNRLDRIAALIQPCPPEITEGWVYCLHGEWAACPITRAAWIAQGRDAAEATRAVLGEVVREAMRAKAGVA